MDHDACTVAELLGIDPMLEPGAYDVGSEPTSEPLRADPKPRAKKIDRRVLAPHYDKIRAGMPDAALAKLTGATIHQVRRWRLALGVKHRPGRVPAMVQVNRALAEVVGEGATLSGTKDPPLAMTPEQAEELRALFESAGLGPLRAKLGAADLDAVFRLARKMRSR